MLKSLIGGGLGNLIKTFLLASVFFLGFPGSGAQALVVATFTGNPSAWSTAAGGPILLEDFTDTTLIPELSIAFGGLLPGAIVGGVYKDSAVSGQSPQPLLTFTGLGVTAFSAEWAFEPLSKGGPTGTDIRFTFVFGYSSSLTSQFFGFVSDVPILGILLDDGDMDQFFKMDNARFVSAVPIPAALPLFLSAIAALGFVGRRRERLAAA